MKIKIILFLIVATTSVAGLCFADYTDNSTMGKGTPAMGSDTPTGAANNSGMNNSNSSY